MKYYVLKNKKHYIAIDKTNCGGFPYHTTIDKAHIFTSVEEIVEYRKLCHENWQICELEFVVKRRYDIEHAQSQKSLN